MCPWLLFFVLVQCLSFRLPSRTTTDGQNSTCCTENTSEDIGTSTGFDATEFNIMSTEDDETNFSAERVTSTLGSPLSDESEHMSTETSTSVASVTESMYNLFLVEVANQKTTIQEPRGTQLPSGDQDALASSTEAVSTESTVSSTELPTEFTSEFLSLTEVTSEIPEKTTVEFESETRDYFTAQMESDDDQITPGKREISGASKTKAALNLVDNESSKSDNKSFNNYKPLSREETNQSITEGEDGEGTTTEDVITTGEFAEGFKEKYVDDGGGGKRQNTEENALLWNGPIVKTQSVKTKVNWTTAVLNGEAVYTDISVYKSHGASYVFRISGGLPQSLPEGIIAWVRDNSHKYPHTEIPYREFGADVVEHLAPPTELPLRCGTKFLEKLSGGKATPIEENPWQVAVLRRDTEAYVCGGAVITRRHVLSAAHCFSGKSHKYFPKHILLRVGDYDKEVREESQVDYAVTDLAIHERYQEKRHLHDIALLTTGGDMPFSAHIYPICLPPPWASYTPGTLCTVSGWGQLGFNEELSESTRYLRSGQVAIVSHDDCRKKTIFSRGVPPEVFCAEDPTKSGVDTCLGDSGGPFACSRNGTFFLYGITAFGSYPCGQDIPSFYTNVSFYKLWILHTLRKGANSTTTKS